MEHHEEPSRGRDGPVAALQEILAISLAAAPWLLIGLFAAGLIKAFVPDAALQRWVGGRGILPVARAAVIGAPLPLCSCGAIPTALALYRGGAGRGPTTAFLVGTPGVGADSVAITYALLGPVMMVARVLGAVVTAISTALLVAGSGEARAAVSAASSDHAPSCRTRSCGSACDGGAAQQVTRATQGVRARLNGGMNYAFGDLLDDISLWMALGLVVAGFIAWAVPPQVLATNGSGLAAMLLMALIGIPMYICATAATPIAVAMMIAGVSPGTVLVFLLAGPITSMATLAVLRREMGNDALVRYLIGIIVTTIMIGLLVDQTIAWADADVVASVGTARELLPEWIEWTALALLVVLALPPARRTLVRLN